MEPCVLGRAALLGLGPGDDLAVPWFATVLDYLACAASVGEAKPGWIVQLRETVARGAENPEHADASEVFAGILAELEAAAGKRRVAAATRATAKEAEDVALTITKGELAKTLTNAADDIKQVHTARAQGLRNGLRKLAKQVMGVRSTSRLEELRAVAAPVFDEALQMRQGIDAAKTQKELQDAAAAEATKRQRESTKNRAAAQTQARNEANAALKPLRKAVSELKRLHARKSTRAGESPLATLRALGLPNGRPVIGQVPGAAAPEPRPRKGLVGFLVDVFDDATTPLPISRWRSTLDQDIVVGSPDLERWGPGTQRLLEPALAYLYSWEDQLVAITGARSRLDRPELEGSSSGRSAGPASGSVPRTGSPGGIGRGGMHPSIRRVAQQQLGAGR